MAHNFTHSFVSLMNYVDDGYVIDDLRELARKAEGERVSIVWLPKKSYTWFKLTRRIRKSIPHHREWLRSHMSNHEIDESSIKELRTDVFMAKNRQIHIEAYVLDDRGKEQFINVKY